MAVGTAELDFGAAPGTNMASVAVTGQASITAAAFVEAFLMGSDETADHTPYEHRIAPIRLSVSDLVAGVGFTIHGFSDHRLTGAFACRWVWSA